jgi:hypothetical protein
MPKCIWESLFKLSTTGRTAPSFSTIANLESLELAIDGTVQDWYAFDAEGFARNLVTAKKITFTGAAKITADDAGNEYLQSKMLAIGAEAQTKFELTFPSGATLTGDCNVNVTGGLGAAEDVDAIEFEVHVDGKPTFSDGGTLTPLAFDCADGSVANATKITAVVPTLTGGNYYLYKLNADLPAAGEDLTGDYWAPYTLGADIPAVNGWDVTLVECSTGDIAVKGGIAPAVVV